MTSNDQHDDRRDHLRVAENTALCQQVGEARPVDVWGHWLTNDKASVDCPKCLEWMHA